MKRIVCDTGPLLHLREADLLTLLQAAGQVYIPPVVEKEMERHASGWSIRGLAWLHVHPPEPSFERRAAQWHQRGLLDPGEAQAISLAQQLGVDWLLTDDSAARFFAQSLEIEVHGSLGMVLWAAATRHLDLPSAEAGLERLARSSLWISARVLAEARSALFQIFSS